MEIQDLTWALVVLSLVGNLFVIKKNVIGQWLWAVSNLGWVTFNLYMEIYSQAFLFAVFFGLSIWAIVEWSKTPLAVKQS